MNRDFMYASHNREYLLQEISKEIIYEVEKIKEEMTRKYLEEDRLRFNRSRGLLKC